MINMDSAAPNKAFHEFLEAGLFTPFANTIRIKKETVFGTSRLDFYAETADKKAFFEVKGVTLEMEGVAKFPDAPTLRGIKHLRELAAATSQGFAAYVIFVIQMQGISHFTPNWDTHPEFGQELAKAVATGVEAYAFDCRVAPDSMAISNPVPIIFSE